MQMLAMRQNGFDQVTSPFRQSLDIGATVRLRRETDWFARIFMSISVPALKCAAN